MENKHNHHCSSQNDKDKAPKPAPWKFAYWTVGIVSTIWLLLRSGTKPRRLAYPCQRVAAANSVGFLAYLASLLGTATLLRRLKVAFTPARLILFTVGLLLTVTLQASVTDPVDPILADSPDLSGWTSDTAVSDVFAITNVPEPQHSLDGGSIPGGVDADEALHDDGVDALVNLMEANGDYFYQTTAHPDGLFAADDVIVIKVNNQWDWRNGTNTDALKGVIYRLVQHPDPGGFTGAVIIAENTQNHNDDWYNQTSGNNSQFQDQSYQDVVQAFASGGYPVCLADWKLIRATFVDEYDNGDSDSGYVLDTVDNKLSYPKFEIDCNGTKRISMRYGLWDGSEFDYAHLKMINMPVLKRHNSAGSTIAVKNYLGFITTAGSNRWISPGYLHCWLLSINDAEGSCPTHTREYGLIGRQMANIRRADLDIVDAIWVNPHNNLGGTSYRQDVLLASRDPFALDYYTADYLLGPLVETYVGSSEAQDSEASHHGGVFRSFLMRNVARLRTEGVTDTINMTDTFSFDQERFQFNVYVADANAPQTPSLSLTAPDGGETWTVGEQEQITWSSTNLDGNIKLEYSTDGFSTPHIIVADTSNDGSYSWTIPDAPSDNVLVRVNSTLTATISDTSAAVFTIASPAPPTLTLLSPNGGETWEVNTQQSIQWASTNLGGNVKLEYSTDGFITAHTIVGSIANDGIYTWTVADDPSDSVLGRVIAIPDSLISDTSDAAFTITVVPPPPVPTLTLQAPNGGETWEVGEQEQITWSSANLAGNVKLEYSTNGFADATVITDSVANTGTYTWTVPDAPSDNVLVRVSSTLTATISDTSDATFTIASLPLIPTLTLQSPNGGEVWEVGTQQQIEWSSVNLNGKVRLDYSTSGSAPSTVITASSVNDGVYDWIVPNDLSTNVLVRVSSTLSDTISDTSDATFTIAGPHTFTDSFKTVSRRDLEGGERITYTILLYDSVSATLTFTDAIPVPLSYVTDTASIKPAGKGTVQFPTGAYLSWSGVVTGTAPVTITFQADVPVTTTTMWITNRALVSRNGAAPVELTATSVLNGFNVYLPVVLKDY